MSAGEIEIISPSPEDADALATVHYRASDAAYAGIFSADALWTLEQTMASWRKLVNDPTATVLAAVAGKSSDGEWLGVSVVQVPDACQHEAELRRLYVIPERWGEGIGSRLLDAALQGAKRIGAASVSLWVLDKNDHARTFYERRGWRLMASEGTHDHDGVHEVRYRYAL